MNVSWLMDRIGRTLADLPVQNTQREYGDPSSLLVTLKVGERDTQDFYIIVGSGKPEERSAVERGE